MMKQERELFASRIGFILMTAGCAIGLGNIWRFPYITGQYGGGLFVLLYLCFLVLLGFPVMMMELSLGRAGRSTYPGAFKKLTAVDSRIKWNWIACILFTGNFILLAFYSVISGWLLAYTFQCLLGNSASLTPEFFTAFTQKTDSQIIWSYIMIAATVIICLGGLRKVIEKSIKVMMIGLLLLLAVLVIKALTLPHSGEGVKFFLMPSFEKFTGNNFLETVHAAMAQAFFTLSLGIGSIAVCGSYFGKERSLPNEGIWIVVFDTAVAISAGLIIFPCCYAFNVSPGSGPSLIFITLPQIFKDMAGGTLWGTLFFLFLTIAAFSTLVAVFENLAAFGIDELNWTRKKSCLFFGALLLIFSLPCIFGFGLWRNFHPMGPNSNILDLEDFIVSDNLLPLGALTLTLFCMHRWGWGTDGFYNELNTGKGLKFPRQMAFYLKWILPLLIFSLWIIGIYKKFF